MLITGLTTEELLGHPDGQSPRVFRHAQHLPCPCCDAASKWKAYCAVVHSGVAALTPITEHPLSHSIVIGERT